MLKRMVHKIYWLMEDSLKRIHLWPCRKYLIPPDECYLINRAKGPQPPLSRIVKEMQADCVMLAGIPWKEKVDKNA